MGKNQENVSWLAGLLTGWGVKESWAKIIAGAIVGALAAAGVLTQTGCEQVQNITPAQVQQAFEVGHDAYHIIHPDKPCIIIPLDETCEK